MIDPLLYSVEYAPPHNIDRAVFCGICLEDRKLKLDPQIACKYCHDCNRIKYYCLSCDAREHGQAKMRHHLLSLIVVGPPVRKKLISRGDATNYPMFLDKVRIHFSAKVFDNGKLVHKEAPRFMDFQTGLSGDSIHVQVLGCRKLLSSDLHSSSDPFVTCTYRGVQIGCTRTRHRTNNPGWSNETFVVPIGDSLPDVRIMQMSQENLLRLEVFDYDMFSANDFLGQVELTKKELIDMAKLSKGQPVTYALKARHHYGTLAVRMAINDDIFSIKIEKGESLERRDGLDQLDPCCRVMFKGRALGTTPFIENNVAPVWTWGNVFSVPVKEVLEEESRILELLRRDDKAHTPQGRALTRIQNVLSDRKQSIFGISSPMTRAERRDRKMLIDELNARALFVIELYDHNYLTPNELVGHVRIPIDALRKMVPTTPVNVETVSKGRSLSHVMFRVTSLSSKLAHKAKTKLVPGTGTHSQESGPQQLSLSGQGETRGGGGGSLRSAKAFSHTPSGRSSQSGTYDDGDGGTLGGSNNADEGGDAGGSSSTSHHRARKMSNTRMASLLGTEIREEGEGDGASSVASSSSDQRSHSQGSLGNEYATAATPNSDSGGGSHGAGGGRKISELLSSATALGETPEMARLRRLSHKPLPPGQTHSTASSAPARQGQGGGWSTRGTRTGLPPDSDSDAGSSETESQQSDEDDLDAEIDAELAAEAEAERRRRLQDILEEEGGEDKGQAEIDPIVPESRLSRARVRGQLRERGEVLIEDDEGVPLIAQSAARGMKKRGSAHSDYDGSQGDEGDSDFEGVDVSSFGENGSQALSFVPSGPPGAVGLSGSVSSQRDIEEGGRSRASDASSSLHSSSQSTVRRRSRGLGLGLGTDTETFNAQGAVLGAIKRALFGSTRWSRPAHFPVTKFLMDDENIDCDRGEIVVKLIRSNRGIVLRGLDAGVRAMSLGELSQIKVRYDRAFSSFSMGTALPPRANIVFTVELLLINGMGKYGAPIRLIKRVGRMLRLVKEEISVFLIKRWYRFLKKIRGVKEITRAPDPSEEASDDAESRGEESSGGDKSGQADESEESYDEAADMKARAGRAQVLDADSMRLGARFMWGFAPEKRPEVKRALKESRPRTEFDIILERERRKAEKKAERQRLRRELRAQNASGGGGGVSDEHELGSVASSDSDGADDHEKEGDEENSRHSRRGARGTRASKKLGGSVRSGSGSVGSSSGKVSGKHGAAKPRGSITSIGQVSTEGSGTPFASGRRSESSFTIDTTQGRPSISMSLSESIEGGAASPAVPGSVARSREGSLNSASSKGKK